MQVVAVAAENRVRQLPQRHAQVARDQVRHLVALPLLHLRRPPPRTAFAQAQPRVRGGAYDASRAPAACAGAYDDKAVRHAALNVDDHLVRAAVHLVAIAHVALALHQLAAAAALVAAVWVALRAFAFGGP